MVHQLHQCLASSRLGRLVSAANIAAGSALGGAAGKRVRGAQTPPGATQLPGTEPEQREDAVSDGGMSFTRPFRPVGVKLWPAEVI